MRWLILGVSWIVTAFVCSVQNVPGLISLNDTEGSYTFTATQDVNASVNCEGLDRFGSASATLTVNSAEPQPPLISAFFTPGTVNVSEWTTLIWNSPDADSCSSTGTLPLFASGTSGSVPYFATSPGFYYITFSCEKDGLVNTKTAYLTIDL